MNNGWIKLYRCLMDKPIWLNSTPEQINILFAILMLANHEGKEWEWKGKKFKVNSGQFITSSTKLAEKCGVGITRQNVRTALKRFEKLGFLTYESTKSGILITIVNWGIYQGEGDAPNQEANQDLTKTQPRPNQDLTTNKNDKNVRMEEYKNNIHTATAARIDYCTQTSNEWWMRGTRYQMILVSRRLLRSTRVLTERRCLVQESNSTEWTK